MPSSTSPATGENQSHNMAATPGLPALIGTQVMLDLGLKDDDLPAIREIANTIKSTDALSVADFGHDVAEHTSGYADELLSQVRNKDLDDAGQALTKVTVIAKGLNMNALSDRRSKVPLVGPWIDKLKLTTGKFTAQFETTKDQLDGLVADMEQTQTGLRTRNGTLELMFIAVKEEHHLLALHIAAGKMRLAELRAEADALRDQSQTPVEVQALADLDALVSSLDIRIGNLQALQQSAFQTLPQIRMVQTNNQVLVEKFHTIREITVPAWKRQFMLALGLNEQRNAVELATTIDDMTNDLLRRNAELLRNNSVETAKANQRLVIDVKTLQQVQDTLIKTVEDVIKIQRDGVQQRQSAVTQIASMQKQLKTKLTRSGATEIA